MSFCFSEINREGNKNYFCSSFFFNSHFSAAENVAAMKMLRTKWMSVGKGEFVFLSFMLIYIIRDADLFR